MLNRKKKKIMKRNEDSIRDLWDNIRYANTHIIGILLLLLLSHFSRVRLCDPIDGSPTGSTIPEILQARTLEWVAIAFSILACEMSAIVQ